MQRSLATYILATALAAAGCGDTGVEPEVTSSACGYPDSDEVPTEPPDDARWVPAANGEAPQVEGLGPGTVEKGVHSCFARSPLGAVLAAMWYILDSTNPRVSREHLAETRIIDGIAQDIPEEPLEDISHVRFAGYLVLGVYTPERVEVDILVRSSREYTAYRLGLVWQHGDWVLRPQLLGWAVVTDQSLYVRWQPKGETRGTADGETPDTATEPEVVECRGEWEDLAALHSEDGNPRGPVPALERRWGKLYAEAARFARTATADDCGPKLKDFLMAWDALEGFQADLGEVDPAADLERAEINLDHHLGLQGMTELPPGGLKNAYRIIRHETPLAIADLQPALRGAAALDPENPAAVEAFLDKARHAKSESVHVLRMWHPYSVIGAQELDEE